MLEPSTTHIGHRIYHWSDIYGTGVTYIVYMSLHQGSHSKKEEYKNCSKCPDAMEMQWLYTYIHTHEYRYMYYTVLFSSDIINAT